RRALFRRSRGRAIRLRPPPAPPMTATPRIAFLASTADDAQAACAKLVDRHGDVPPEDAEVLVALGGDGFMLQTLHRHGGLGKPVYGMKLGTVGFLMNHLALDGLLERIHAAEPAVLRPLERSEERRVGKARSPQWRAA